METLLAVEHEHHHYFGSPVKHHGPGRVGPSPSKSFRSINCRTFQSAGSSGILPTPPTTPVSIKRNTPERSTSFYSDSKAASRINSRTNPIAISDPRNMKKEKPFSEGFSFSELWAGPAYSNSPPPSSLPIPKFPMRTPKRTVSLELPRSVSETQHTIAKSAPSSLTLEHGFPLFNNADDSATAALRRILNLDV